MAESTQPVCMPPWNERGWRKRATISQAALGLPVIPKPLPFAAFLSQSAKFQTINSVGLVTTQVVQLEPPPATHAEAPNAFAQVASDLDMSVGILWHTPATGLEQTSLVRKTENIPKLAANVKDVLNGQGLFVSHDPTERVSAFH